MNTMRLLILSVVQLLLSLPVYHGFVINETIDDLLPIWIQKGMENKLDFDTLRAELKENLEKDRDGTVEHLKKLGLTQIVDLEPSHAIEKHSHLTSTALPVVQMHGMGDFAKNTGMTSLAKSISDYLDGAYVLNVQIGDNFIEDILNGFLKNLDDQVDYFANVVRNDVQLQNGFNAVGYSQGNLVIRGFIERYNSPPVFNFISMHGPLAGVASFPGCSLDRQACRVFAELLGVLAYKPAVQEHLAQANYFRDPFKISTYQAQAKFLPDLNNEDGSTNSDYNNNLKQLHSLVLVKANNDSVVIPNDSEWFGFYRDLSFDKILTFKETAWYLKDSFGLKSLDKANKVYFNTTEGDHLKFSVDYLLDLVGIYFTK